MAFIFRRRDNGMIEHMCGILQLIMQRVFNERLLRELEGLLRGVKNLAPSRVLEVKRIDKYIVFNLNQIKEMIDKSAPDDKILALTTETGLRLLEREQKCIRTKTLRLR